MLQILLYVILLFLSLLLFKYLTPSLNREELLYFPSSFQGYKHKTLVSFLCDYRGLFFSRRTLFVLNDFSRHLYGSGRLEFDREVLDVIGKYKYLKLFGIKVIIVVLLSSEYRNEIARYS